MEQKLVKVRVKRGGSTGAQGEVVCVPVAGALAPALRTLDRRLAAGTERRARAVGFKGREGELLVVDRADVSLVLVGIGKDPNRAAWRRVGATARREAERQRARRATIFVGGAALGPAEIARLAEGLHLAGYRFEAHRQPDSTSKLTSVLVLGTKLEGLSETRDAIANAETVAACVLDARDLVNHPPSVATPSHLASYARRAGRGIKALSVQVWDAARMEREGVAGVLAVARGAKEPPRFIVMRYRADGASRHVALVGKGITFDSGGLSLKPPKSMETMKYDMAGGAAVLATVAAVARLGLPVNVTGFVPATENLPGQGAQKPGDVIRYANDKTVEVLNTDAEGRLVLADALVLASREKPDAIIDLATLTGAARVALGIRYAAIMGSEQSLVDALIASGSEAGEMLWQLPLVAEYGESLKSSVADIRNIGHGPEGGTITAGLFLEHFVDGVPWAHLDIAGPAFAESDWPECPRGGSGFGVRLLVEYLRGLAGS